MQGLGLDDAVFLHIFGEAQKQLDAIIKALDSGQDELRKDNAAIQAEQRNMWTAMEKLKEYDALAAALDAALRASYGLAGNPSTETAIFTICSTSSSGTTCISIKLARQASCFT